MKLFFVSEALGCQSLHSKLPEKISEIHDFPAIRNKFVKVHNVDNSALCLCNASQIAKKLRIFN